MEGSRCGCLTLSWELGAPVAAVLSAGSPGLGDAPWCREGTTPSLWGHASPIRCSQGDIRGDHPFFRALQPSGARLGALLHAGGLSPTHHTCPLQMDLHDETYSMPDDVFESPPLSATYLRMHSVGEDARASPEGEQPPL